MAEQCCDLSDLENEYRRFLRRYAPLDQRRPSALESDDEACFKLRLGMIHDYRKILLRDPTLPPELLPGDWVGAKANTLCASIYKSIWAASERFVSSITAQDNGLKEFSPSFRKRFGGLGSLN
jgi:phenylacetic acid degradation operon negative regulatory protein